MRTTGCLLSLLFLCLLLWAALAGALGAAWQVLLFLGSLA